MAKENDRDEAKSPLDPKKRKANRTLVIPPKRASSTAGFPSTFLRPRRSGSLAIFFLPEREWSKENP